MQTVILKEISGYKIIRGFSRLTPDPVETKKIIEQKLKKSKIAKRIESLLRQIQTINKAIISIHPAAPHCENETQIRQLFISEDKANQIIKYKDEREKVLIELKELYKEQEKEKAELKIKHTVYFEPPPYEIAKIDEEIQILKEKFKKLDKHQLLDVHGNIIWNYTDTTWWLKKDKWESKNYNLGEKKDPFAKIWKDLTDSERLEIENQIEQDRIDALSPEEKKKEKQKVIDKISMTAVNKKVSFEIAGDTSKKAFAKSKKWYQEKIEEIEKKYG